VITAYLSIASAVRIGAVLLVLAVGGLYAATRREKPTDWDAPAGDLEDNDQAFEDIRAMLPDHTGGAA
jgi:hypothetical protein